MNRVRLPRVLGRTATGTMRCRNPGYVGRGFGRINACRDHSIHHRIDGARCYAAGRAGRRASRRIADPLT